MNENVTDPIEYARENVGRDPLATFLGITVEEVREAYSRCSIVLKEHHMNSVERAHGSTIYALADQSLAVASNSTGNAAFTINFTINYISGASLGDKIIAVAQPINIGRVVSIWGVEIRSSNDKLIATGEGLAYHKNFK